MCLWVQQKSGERVKLAKLAHEAVVAGDLDEAERIYKSVTGERFLPHNRSVDSPWIKYCMTDRIMSYVNYDDLDMGDIVCRYNDDRPYFEALRRRAERKYGGVWEICYEY